MKKFNSGKMLVKDVFIEGKYRIFREFCQGKEISHIKSINEKTINEFSEVKGVGTVRLKQVIDKLESLDIFLNSNNSQIPFDIDRLKINQEENLRSLDIKSVFQGSKFIILRKYCEDRKILTLFDMTNEDINDFKKEKGIGKKRYKDFIDVLIEKTRSGNIKSIDKIAEIALNKLNSHESIVIIGRLIEDLSIEDTAGILEINNKEVKETEKIALKRLREILDQYDILKSLKLMARSFKTLSLKSLEKRNTDEIVLITNLIKNNMIKGLSYSESTNTAYFNIIKEETA